MITGLTTMTAGECSIFGHHMPDDLADIRRLTGICPQQNVLFPSLTVLEHLTFFGTVKGLHGTALRAEADGLIADVGLSDKRDTPAASLSGGMKRKLQLAMALIGGSQFVLLDEPTSGMDPYSRRSTWELLQRKRAGRVIVLTTHFLEEADILGDRIAIMSEGLVRCAGSSLFLKTRFGAGYVLSMAKNTAGDATALASGGSGTGGADGQLQRVADLVSAFVPDAQLTSHVAGEIIFSLPLRAAPAFGDLFNALQGRAAALGVGSYGVSLTSLEQVFIRLAKEAGHTGDDDLKPTWAQRQLGKVAEMLGFRYARAPAPTLESEAATADDDEGRLRAAQYVESGIGRYVVDEERGGDRAERGESRGAALQEGKHDDAPGGSAPSSVADTAGGAIYGVEEGSVGVARADGPSGRDWDDMLKTGDARVQVRPLSNLPFSSPSDPYLMDAHMQVRLGPAWIQASTCDLTPRLTPPHHSLHQPMCIVAISCTSFCASGGSPRRETSKGYFSRSSSQPSTSSSFWPSSQCNSTPPVTRCASTRNTTYWPAWKCVHALVLAHIQARQPPL